MSTGKSLTDVLTAEAREKLTELFNPPATPTGPAVRIPPKRRKAGRVLGLETRRARRDTATAKRRARAKLAKASRRRNRRHA